MIKDKSSKEFMIATNSGIEMTSPNNNIKGSFSDIESDKEKENIDRSQINDDIETVPGFFDAILRQEYESKSPKFNMRTAIFITMFMFLLFTIFSLPNIIVYSHLSEYEVNYTEW
jgi:hypothetical protein